MRQAKPTHGHLTARKLGDGIWVNTFVCSQLRVSEILGEMYQSHGWASHCVLQITCEFVCVCVSLLWLCVCVCVCVCACVCVCQNVLVCESEFMKTVCVSVSHAHLCLCVCVCVCVCVRVCVSDSASLQWVSQQPSPLMIKFYICEPVLTPSLRYTTIRVNIHTQSQHNIWTWVQQSIMISPQWVACIDTNPWESKQVYSPAIASIIIFHLLMCVSASPLFFHINIALRYAVPNTVNHCLCEGAQVLTLQYI